MMEVVDQQTPEKVKSNSSTNYSYYGKKRYPIHKSIGFYPGNYINSLIQIFNKNCYSLENYMKECMEETYKADVLLKSPVITPVFNKDLPFNVPLERGVSCTDKYYQENLEAFFNIMSYKKNTFNYKPLNKKYFKTDLSRYEIDRIIKWLVKLPTYKTLVVKGLSKKKAQENFIEFSLKVISNFYTESLSKKSIYQLPSIFLKKLSYNYPIFKKALFPYITIPTTGYCFGTKDSNYCIGYSLKVFRSVFLTHIIKTKKISLSYCEGKSGKTKKGSIHFDRMLSLGKIRKKNEKEFSEYIFNESIKSNYEKSKEKGYENDEKTKLDLTYYNWFKGTEEVKRMGTSPRFIECYYNMCQDLIPHKAPTQIILGRLGIHCNELEKEVFEKTAKRWNMRHYYLNPLEESDRIPVQTFQDKMKDIDPLRFQLNARKLKRYKNKLTKLTPAQDVIKLMS